MPDETDEAPAVCIASGVTAVEVRSPDGPLEIRRIADPEHRLSMGWSRTSRAAPPAVLQPLAPVPDVVPLGEFELVEALQSEDVVVAEGRKTGLGSDDSSDLMADLRCEPKQRRPLQRGWRGADPTRLLQTGSGPKPSMQLWRSSATRTGYPKPNGVI